MMLCIIQARMGSNRLPGKMLKSIGKKTTIQHVLDQVKKAKLIDKIIVATTNEEIDDDLEVVVNEEKIEVFRGEPNDVLDRYYKAALPYSPNAIVRITGDCPFIDPVVIDKVIDTFNKSPELDYVSNVHPPTYPDGMDVEVIKFDKLKEIWKTARLNSEREHVTLRAWQNPDIYSIGTVKYDTDNSDIRITLDEFEDLELLNKLYTEMNNKILPVQKIIDIIRQNPEIDTINMMHQREEGLKKSLKEDTIVEERLTNEEAERQLLELIPGGAHTYSKGKDQFPSNAPKVIERGDGAYIWDVESNKYLSWCMGLFSVVLGHAYKPVIEKVIEQLYKGANFQRPGIQELEYAQMINKMVPCAEMVKFGKNGSTATTAAIKLSRAYNNKYKVAICAQHPFYSYDDWFISSTPCKIGIPEAHQDQTVKFNYNDIESVRKILVEQGDQITALIMEPLKFEEPKDNFLHKVKELCHEFNVVFILDEMITGFRFPLGGAQKYYDIKPDLTTFGKALGNGFSIAFLAGKREIMELGGIDEGRQKVFLVSTTHGAELHAIAASMATIEEIEKHNVIDHIWGVGEALINKVTTLINEHDLQDYIAISGHPYLPLMTFKDHNKEDCLGYKTLIMQELIKEGILFQGFFVASFMHKDNEVTDTLKAMDKAFIVYKQALDAKNYRSLLVGPVIKPVFRADN